MLFEIDQDSFNLLVCRNAFEFVRGVRLVGCAGTTYLLELMRLIGPALERRGRAAPCLLYVYNKSVVTWQD